MNNGKIINKIVSSLTIKKFKRKGEVLVGLFDQLEFYSQKGGFKVQIRWFESIKRINFEQKAKIKLKKGT